MLSNRPNELAFDTRLYVGDDTYGIITAEQTKSTLMDADNPSLLDKLETVQRHIAMINNTITLLKNCEDQDLFGTMVVPSDGGDSYRDPWFEGVSRIYFEACQRFVAMPKPPALTYGVRIGATTKVEKAERSFMAEAKAMGLLSLEYEREIEFSNAKITFKADAQAGGAASASASGRLADQESVVNDLAGGNPVTLASGELKAEVFFGFRANAGVAVESKYLDASVDVDAMVGAAASAKAEGKITTTGVSASIAAEAFVGAKASVEGKATLKLFGLPILQEKVTATVSVGAGVAGKLGFELDIFEGATANIKLEATVGVGAGIESSTTVNHYNLILAGTRGYHELQNLLHNAKARHAGYRRLDFGSDSADHALLNRLVGNLETLRNLRTAEFDRLKQIADAGSVGMLMAISDH